LSRRRRGIWRSARRDLPGGSPDLSLLRVRPQLKEATMSFDPIQYKTTTRQQWEDAAQAWDRWEPVLETWLGEATNRML
jgi:hypothetical protein